jgi:hypothetical protein
MELVMNFVSNNPGWTFMFIIAFFWGISEVCHAIFNRKGSNK